MALAIGMCFVLFGLGFFVCVCVFFNPVSQSLPCPLSKLGLGRSHYIDACLIYFQVSHRYYISRLVLYGGILILHLACLLHFSSLLLHPSCIST